MLKLLSGVCCLWFQWSAKYAICRGMGEQQQVQLYCWSIWLAFGEEGLSLWLCHRGFCGDFTPAVWLSLALPLHKELVSVCTPGGHHGSDTTEQCINENCHSLNKFEANSCLIIILLQLWPNSYLYSFGTESDAVHSLCNSRWISSW